MNQPKRTSLPLHGECQAGAGGTPEQEAFLAVLKTADVLQGELAELLKPAELSPTQYNVLRVLRGAGSDGLPSGQIAERMLTRDPDMTRLLDRLEKRGFTQRARDTADRRVVRSRITAAGLRVLAGLDKPVVELHRRQLGHLAPRELISLSNLLERARERTG